jgi:O-methyltransferase
MKKALINLTQRVVSLADLNLAGRMRLMNRARSRYVYDGMDYVRLSSLELCATEIYAKNVTGSVAELGVYKGEFAEKISQAFPDRPFYLFDTFTGFDTRDTAIDQQDQFSTGKQDFSDTSVTAVLGRIPNAQNCIVRQGFFPETAQDVNDTFAFVSIDTDLYQPIYAGLHFFYPRLQPGGYIFVHDYNNAQYRGAQKAVRDFCAEAGVGFFPLSDCGGSAILTK